MSATDLSSFWLTKNIFNNTNNVEIHVNVKFLHCNHGSFILAVNEKEVQSLTIHTAQKMKFFIKDFFSKCDQIRISQNGQTHSKNSSTICRRIVWVCLTILWTEDLVRFTGEIL